jgi:inorganic pyrophosphatase
VAVFWLCDQGEREPKVVCVPGGDPNWQHVEDLDEVPKHLVEEIAHFFVADKQREGQDVAADGWGDGEQARTVVDEGFARGACLTARPVATSSCWRAGPARRKAGFHWARWPG